MRNRIQINKLFQKFIDNRLNEEEFVEFMHFVEKDTSKDHLKELLNNHFDENKMHQNPKNNLTAHQSKMLFQRITNRVNREKVQISKKKKFLKRKQKSQFFKIAASVLIVFGVYYLSSEITLTTAPLTESTIDPNAITLTLDDGSKQLISENGIKKIINDQGNIVGEQIGNELNYSNSVKSDKLIYNELTIPYGKRFDLILSDGTKIKLNAGSYIKYPVRFLKGKNRRVTVKGEAFFDVTTDKQHPFIVNLNEIEVQVLGTQFNISFYPEDKNISTVLIEGSVALYTEKTTQKTKLSPGQKASWDKTKKVININEVDTQVHTAWKDGVLLFKNISFSDIRKKLQRHFNVSIQNEFIQLDNQIYTASFSSDESIENILEYFNEDTPFESRIKNDKIIISKPIVN